MNYERAIKTIRAVRGLSQQDLAKRMEVDEAFISRLGKRGNSPSSRTLEKVASALEVPLYLLVLIASDEQDLSSEIRDTAKELVQQLLELLVTKPKAG